MISLISKIAIVILGATVGYFLAPGDLEPANGAMLGAGVAAIIAVIIFLFERSKPGMMIGGLLGFLISSWFSFILIDVIFSGAPGLRSTEVGVVITYAVAIATVFGGTAFGFSKGRWLTPHNIKATVRVEEERKSYKILDTSVIIDGRIADISETGFLGGILVAPQFVLKELQQIADSSQSLKRNRGRRGLDILQKIKMMKNVQVIFPEQDFPDVPEVDLKLIELARLLGGKIVTNDFNLNKVAQLRGVDVLNINELANALKPVVLPGELMNVFILKEGKEQSQGIGYLDDGTMIVVDNSRHLIGKTIELVVTSVLQTTAGKMIFGKTDDGKASHLASGAQG